MSAGAAIMDGTATGGASVEAFIDAVGLPIADNDWTAVRAVCDDYLRNTGPLAEAFYLRALAAFVEEDVAGALIFAQRAFDADGDVNEYAELLARLYATVGDIQQSSFFGKLATALPSVDHVATWRMPAGLPTFSQAFLNISAQPLLQRAVAAVEVGQWTDGENWFSQHLELNPQSQQAYLGLTHCLFVQGKFQAAISTLRAGLHALPGDEKLASQLGTALTAVGQFADARAIHLAATAQSDDPDVHAQAAIDAAFDPEADPSALIAQFRRWGERCGLDTVTVMPPRSATARRLTLGVMIGVVDRRRVAPALARILGRLDRQRFRLVGFGVGNLSITTNAMFRNSFEGWHDVREMDPITLASVVGTEDVDILIDVTGFLMPNTLVAFGARMAPVQVSWLGAPAGTGLACMDAVLSDPFLDPEASGDPGLREAIVRLELGSQVIDLASHEHVVEAPTDAQYDRGPTFVADATMAELTPTTVACWAAVLNELPEATLLLRDHEFQNEENANRLLALFGNFGITHRIETLSNASPAALFAQADVVLLPFGATRLDVAVDALAAGVPVICWAPEGRYRRRVGSFLAALGLGDDLVAAGADEYRTLAVEWLMDHQRREQFAESIAERLALAPFFDDGARADDLAAVLESLWRRFVTDAG